MIQLIKRLFGSKKTNSSNGDVKIDYEVKDIQKGFVLEYDMRSWIVKDVATYEWDNGVKDLEFTIFDGKDKLFLNYESLDASISMYWSVQINSVWPDGKLKIRKNQGIQDSTFSYKGGIYDFFAEASARVKGTKESYNMQNWVFASNDQNSFVSFNKYDDSSIDAYAGKKLKEYEISNIFPTK
jgi:hypothetical protein